MKTITLKCHVYQSSQHYAGQPTSYALYSFKSDISSLGLYVGPVDVTYEVPANFNPVAAELAALAKKREEAGKAFADAVRDIHNRIAKLTAIGYEVAA